MKSIAIILCLTLISIFSYGQVKFEKGYFIGNDNQRIECLIKNSDLDNNPKEFKYKLTERDDPQKGDIVGIKEFGIINVVKFIRANTRIDRSTRIFSNYSDIKEPIWSNEQLFLKVILEGKASLYCYVEADLRFYFYSVNDSAIKQLVYKDYKVDSRNAIYFEKENDNVITTNNGFRLQLWNDVRCADATISSVEKLSYKQNELVSYFNKYNSCVGSPNVSYVYKEKRDFFNLRITPGINFSSMSIPSLYNIDFENKINLRLGLEAEFILPFNKNKWGLVIEPTYKSFNSEAETSIGKVTITYNSIEFPFGLRYYLFLDKGLKLFINGFMIPGHTLDFNNTIDFEYPYAGSIEIIPVTGIRNFAFGCGANYKKISAEMRYYTKQNPLIAYESWTAEYKRLALIIGFKIF
jgi:hypothetical protein